jgi:glutaredoxin-like protein
MESSLIPEQQKELLKKEFSEKLEKPVTVAVFTQEFECSFCAATKRLMLELASLSSKIKVEVYDFIANADKAAEYGIDKIPAVAIFGEKDSGIRFYGIPYGYEFQTLFEDLIAVSKGRTDLSDAVKQGLKGVVKPVNIQVFVTLTCPVCPITARMAHKFALENGMIKANVIDAMEFPQIGLKYGVMGVPKTVINEKVEFLGAVPEEVFLQYVLQAAQ